MKRTPRPYQTKFINDSRANIMKGNRKILCWLGTGGGKGFIIPEIAGSALARNKKVLFLVHGRSLVFQAKNDQFKHLDAGLIMGSERGFNPVHNLQIASSDTLRGKMVSHYAFLSQFDLILIDEAHQAVSDSFRETITFFTNPNAVFIGFTATPFPVNGRVHDFWDVCLNPISMTEMRDLGFLLDCQIFAPGGPDMSAVRIDRVTKDYNTDDLFKVVTGNQIIGDVVQKYKDFGKNKPAILFAVNVEHSKQMAAAFTLAGIPAIHCDANHTQKERDYAIGQLKKGLIKVICNVNLFSTGTDIPCLEIGIMLRPTMSECLWVQQIGRLLRPYKICKKCGKERGAEADCPLCQSVDVSFEIRNAILLDHAGNIARLGGPYKERQPALSLEYYKRKALEKIEEIIVCKQCDYTLDEPAKYCPYCGAPMENKRHEKGESGVQEIEGALHDVDPEFEKRIRINQMIIRYKQLDTLQKIRRWKLEFVFNKLFSEFGQDLYLVADKINVSTKFLDMLVSRQKISVAKKEKEDSNNRTYEPSNLIRG